MSETFYRKYRPQQFKDVVGQKHIVTTLQNALALGRVGHAYLFTGPRGTGKTTLARIFAKAINCLDRKAKDSEPCGQCEHCRLFAEGRSMDVIEIDAASHTGVDNIRELRETVTLPPTLGSHKIYIIDEVHMLSQGAFNALLKTLEEPPAHVIFILATTALHKVPDTIVSRAQTFSLARFPIKSIVDKLKSIAKKEKLKADDEALEMIALTAEGGMRDAESLFMQVANMSDGAITAERVTEVLGTATKESVFALLDLIRERKLTEALLFVRALSLEGKDLYVFSGGLLATLRDLLLESIGEENRSITPEGYTREAGARLHALALHFSSGEVLRMIEFVQIAVRDTKTAFIEELPLEIALVKILTPADEAGDGSASNARLNDANTNGSGNSRSATPEKRPPVSPMKPAVKETRVREKTALQTPAAPETSDALSYERVRDLWPRILDEVKRRNASIFVALSQSRLLRTEGSVIVLCVKYSFHKERLEDKNYQDTLHGAFDILLGTKVRLKFILESEEAKTSEATAAPEAYEASPNPLLGKALEMLGGRIVTES